MSSLQLILTCVLINYFYIFEYVFPPISTSEVAHWWLNSRDAMHTLDSTLCTLFTDSLLNCELVWET
jgi:hypothetical protein